MSGIASVSLFVYLIKFKRITCVFLAWLDDIGYSRKSLSFWALQACRLLTFDATYIVTTTSGDFSILKFLDYTQNYP